MGFRRITAGILTMFSLLNMCGCTSIPWGISGSYDSYKYREEFADRLGYTRLDPQAQLLYGALYTAVTDTFTEDTMVTVPGDGDTQKKSYGVEVPLPTPVPVSETARLEQVVAYFQYDNPQFFHICTTQYATATKMVNGKECYVTLSLLYTYAPEERATAKVALEAAVTDILADCPDTTDQYLTELYLHDRLTAACTYDDEAAANDRHSNPHARSAYGALVNGNAICGGYTQAMTLLLQRAGIAATHVMSEDGEHVWNLVRINGRYYHLDATWNDTDDKGYHLYFNCATDDLSADHTIGKEHNNLPVCDATQDNYYRRTGIYANIRDSGVLAEKIAAAIKSGDEVIEIFTRPEAYEYCLLFLKNQARTQASVNSHLADSGKRMWDYDLYSIAEEHKLFLHMAKK